MAKRQNTVDTKKTILDSLAERPESMLTDNLHLPKQKKVEIIHYYGKSSK